MKAYHGSNTLFDTFDASKAGEGVGANLICKGINLNTSPSVADAYRQQVSTPDSDFTAKMYFSENGVALTGLTDVIDKHLRTIAEGSNHEVNAAKEALEELNAENAHAEYGVVYEVVVPGNEHLLVWEGDVDSQPFDVVEVLRDLYGDDEVEEIYDDANEESPLGVNQDFFDDVFERALLSGVDETREDLNDISPGFDWSRLDDIIREHCPGLIGDMEDAGRALYSSLSHSLEGEDAAIDLLSRYGVHGVRSHQEFTGYQGECEIIVIWKSENAVIKRIIDPSEIEREHENKNDYEMSP